MICQRMEQDNDACHSPKRANRLISRLSPNSGLTERVAVTPIAGSARRLDGVASRLAFPAESRRDREEESNQGRTKRQDGKGGRSVPGLGIHLGHRLRRTTHRHWRGEQEQTASDRTDYGQIAISP
jgi:hypothetical protein